MFAKINSQISNESHEIEKLKEYRKYVEKQSNILKSIFVVCVFVFLLLIIFFHIPKEESIKSETVKNEIMENEAKVGIVETYFHLYCDEKCNQEQKNALSSIIELMRMPKKEKMGLIERPDKLIFQKNKKNSNDFQSIIEWIHIKKENVFGLNSKIKYQPQLISIPLKILKHEKMTSPSLQAKGIFLKVLEYFTTLNKYDKIEYIFDKTNERSWKSEGNYLTVLSDNWIRPKIIEITVPFESEVLIFGLKIEEILSAVEHQFLNVFLGKYKLTAGSNKLPCVFIECEDYYTLILFVMNPIELQYLAIYKEE